MELQVRAELGGSEVVGGGREVEDSRWAQTENSQVSDMAGTPHRRKLAGRGGGTTVRGAPIKITPSRGGATSQKRGPAAP